MTTCWIRPTLRTALLPVGLDQHSELHEHRDKPATPLTHKDPALEQLTSVEALQDLDMLPPPPSFPCLCHPHCHPPTLSMLSTNYSSALRTALMVRLPSQPTPPPPPSPHIPSSPWYIRSTYLCSQGTGGVVKTAWLGLQPQDLATAGSSLQVLNEDGALSNVLFSCQPN